jgi:chromate reductase, NAD(P)H dehydrogenase (quinone)
MPKTILAISGSIYSASYNTMLLKAAQKLAPSGVTINLLTLESIPMFNQDLESDIPPEVVRFRSAIEAADGILISTPEYNRSIPGVLKNAIDWASRTYEKKKNSFAGKPLLVIGATQGNLGTVTAQYHLKKIMAYLGMQVIGQPEFYLSAAYDKFDEAGDLKNEDTKNHLKAAIDVLVSKL